MSARALDACQKLNSRDRFAAVEGGNPIRTTLIIILGLALLTVGLPIGTSTPQPAGAPVENGDFEIGYTPEPATQALAGTPVDECVGIGHQAFFGPDSAPGALTGGKAGSPNADDADPQQAADNVTADPIWWVEFQSGYGHCVYDPQGQGVDIVWLQAKERSEQAALWSYHPRDASAEFGFNFDDDPFDKEIRVESSPSNGGDHNLWQNVFNPGRTYAFTANFDGLAFDLEDGEIPDDASVKVSLGAEPLNVQERFTAPAYIDCVLGFPGSALQASADANDGRVSVSPLNAEVGYSGPSDPDCPDEKTEENLGRLTIVQLSFWNFNDGTEPVVIDDVALDGATAHAEEAADGNLRICTDTPAQAVDDATCGDDTVGK